ncbi:unnamed protein product [Cuscuta campestris]|uniref:Uncharacterized protein n=1 Tax=Cuscuta campestris TaxID=132261 RepID=A0A484KHN7_9ASTE|nr:unnamed protein product [Cuscuta campestris]
MIGFVGIVEADKSYGGGSSGKKNQQVVGYGKRDVVQSYPYGTAGPAGNRATQVREVTSRVKSEDKRTGGYERVTVKEKMTKGETHFERSTGRIGIADEYKKSSTVKIGDKTGYTEYYHEERVRRVNYDCGKSSNRLGQGSQNTTISVSHGGPRPVGIKKNTTSSVTVNHGKNQGTKVTINYGNKKNCSSSAGKRMLK